METQCRTSMDKVICLDWDWFFGLSFIEDNREDIMNALKYLSDEGFEIYISVYDSVYNISEYDLEHYNFINAHIKLYGYTPYVRKVIGGVLPNAYLITKPANILEFPSILAGYHNVSSEYNSRPKNRKEVQNE